MVIGADHVYRMDFEQMLAAHIASGARATVAGIEATAGVQGRIYLPDSGGTYLADAAAPFRVPGLKTKDPAKR